ncbi:MAG: antitoxin [Clostridia bacterium]|nr:antitoxin [Clostridia bacterium]MDD4387589.1 antitoxin [Clostridia bacterium]
MINKKIRGRPQGKNKDQRLNIMINSKMKDEFKRVAEANGSNVSVKICELISDYLKKNKGDN